ncbi:redoxin domain-containing protein [Formicincola oecophyllae]|uniref:Alkyl hydroperoxide reductase C n=1 Tax=Formicincola oecophyllae TaxID=2558361 RepID=A0A4Y6UAH9_9PROT|nr:redoxin domain-containing protein [Formicincola oecophyllae]QDH13447.1 redoxin domain-containing protein [Formicincola oecophyllae]
MPKIGSTIKPFLAHAYDPKKDAFIEVSEKDLIGPKKWSVIFFYPADFTFVCPTELEDLAENYAAFEKLGVQIYSVSTDKEFSHKAWHDTSDAIRKVQFPMLGDPAGVLATNFDVLMDSPKGDTFWADRGTFLIDPEGRIQYVEITSPGVGRSAKELLGKIEAAQYVASHPGEVCPAHWKEGGKVLTPGINLVGKI